MKSSGVFVTLVLALAGSLAFASRLWVWVLNFDPGFTFASSSATTGAPLTTGVTVFLIDGLRVDASRTMKTLNDLRRRGADVEATVGTPSFSRPGRATIAVGAFPSVHGVTSNRQARSLSMDNVFRRVAEIGGTCRVAGSKIWEGLFGADISKCGVYRPIEGKEGPGTFVRQVGSVRSSQEEGVNFALEKPATLRVTDVVSTDFAAHEYGGSSPEYLAEVARIDGVLANIVLHMDLDKETLIVTADHGHRDEGGHGGEEAKVLSIPIVMAGAGIAAGTKASGSQADIASTVSALLGATLPAGSAGRPIDTILRLDDVKRTALREAVDEQQTNFDRALAIRLALPRELVGPRGLEDRARAFRAEAERDRLPVAGLSVVLIIALVALSVFFARPDLRALGVGVAVAALGVLLVTYGPLFVRLSGFSFSAINYDEMLKPFFFGIMIRAAIVATVSALASATAVRAFRKDAAAPHHAVQAACTGLILCGALAVGLVVLWCGDVLLSPVTLPGPDQMVLAYAVTLSLTAAATATLLCGLLLGLLPRNVAPQA